MKKQKLSGKLVSCNPYNDSQSIAVIQVQNEQKDMIETAEIKMMVSNDLFGMKVKIPMPLEITISKPE
ncbi:hypothetical protein KAR91_78375 [Candidatus Pacearchaeota archaeon]|nr:hypothetical protein [Candidatus Pacearchaeota archaeon]